ncbi:GD15280 [Drosophila simulans]|uniref:GD15280 n=1 Tax=Drosophila simulans TaxID=7240 RepID=B4NS97_DROSI|nr:GD15280 [Drosophila simulans]
MQSALWIFCRQGSRSFATKTQGFRSFASKLTYHADPPCQPVDPLCHHVPSGGCVQARETINLKLPHEKLLQQERDQKKERKCCVLRSAAKNPCVGIRRPKAPKPEEKPFRSMWEPPCRANEQPFCKEMLPRFDAIYYHPSNKCRCYQRTWVECSPVKQRLKKVCCLDAIEPPEILYRIRPPCPGTCPINYTARRLLCEDAEWKRDPTRKCPKFFHPCCKLARCNPRCSRGRKPTLCTKLRAPYPCYSEKVRGRRPLRKRECLCLETIPKCIALAERLRRDGLNLK